MRPAYRPITVYRGDTYTHHVTLTDGDGTPIDITGYTYTAQLRASPESPDVLADATTSVNGPTGEVWVTIDAAVTATLHPGRRRWDLQQDDDGVITTILAGPADVVGDVTREEL